MYFYLIIFLQGFCLYHCFSKGNSYYWMLAIIFLPLVGSFVYLLVNVVQKGDIDKVQQGLTTIVNPTKKISDLENRFKFAESFENQVALADAYLEAEQHEKAIENYEASLKDIFKDDFYVISKLQEAYYFSSQFDASLRYAERIRSDSKFKKSRAAFLYALAMEKQGNIKVAESYLVTFDAPYARYPERLELAKFFTRHGKTTEAKEILNELISESEKISKKSYNQNRVIIKKAKELLAAGL